MRFYVKPYGVYWAVCKREVRLLPFHKEEYYDVVLDKFETEGQAERHAYLLNQQNWDL